MCRPPRPPQKVFDHLDFLRGVEVFLNCIPAASIEAMRLGFLSQGIDACNKLLIMDELLDSRPVLPDGEHRHGVLRRVPRSRARTARRSSRSRRVAGRAP